MTHDELLAKIPNFGFGTKSDSALRAVVELHKRHTYIQWITVSEDGLTRNQKGMEYTSDSCSQCLEEYPCPTIQAIEKELRG